MDPGDQLYTIKITANDEDNGIYILTSSAIDIGSGRCISQEIVASNMGSVMNINLKATHKDFLNRIQNIVYSGKQLKNVTKALQEQSKKSYATEGFLEEIIHYSETKDYSKLSYLFEQLFIKSCGMGKYNVQVAAEKIPSSEINKTTMGQGLEEPTEILEGDGQVTGEPGMAPRITDIPPGAKVVQFKFILSPVSGTTVRELFNGSPIVVRLNQADPKTLDTIQSLNLKAEDGSIKPIAGFIHKITHRGNESEVIVNLGENLFGKYLEEENSVKVRTTLAEIKNRTLSPSPTPDYKKNIEALKNDNSLFFYIMAIAALFAIGVFAVVFLA